MRKINVSLASLVIGMSLCGTARAQAHRNAYGGSTSHSSGSTSRTNAYGGSSSHTAGEGTSHTSAYGTSTSHAYGGGTCPHKRVRRYNFWKGWVWRGTYQRLRRNHGRSLWGGRSTHHPVRNDGRCLCVSSTHCLLCVSSARNGGLLPNRLLQLCFDWWGRGRGSCSRHGRWRCCRLFPGQFPKRERLQCRLLSWRRQYERCQCCGFECQCGGRQCQCRGGDANTAANAVARQPTARIRWAQFMRRYLPVASVPMSRQVEPIICAATPGSVRPLGRTECCTASSQHRNLIFRAFNNGARHYKLLKK